MKTRIMPCIHFHINNNPKLPILDLGHYSGSELLLIKKNVINKLYDEMVLAYEELPKDGWIVNLLGNSLDFYRNDISTIEQLTEIICKNLFRKKYGENFSLITQLIIFNNMNKEELLKSIVDKESSMVVFSTPFCGPCRAMKPLINSLSFEYNIIKIDATENSDLAAELNVQAVPTMIFFKKDKETSRKIGITSEEEIKKELEVK